eukprot:Hpha_TRINITY_DN15198_c2_g1::TRINITY_DN15198_c2_g1_i2::g.127333::m.127333
MLAVAGVLGAAAVASRPNVALVIADDLGWEDVSYHGGKFKTPEIDALAASGVKLEKWYTQPICSPTRAALMTGRHPFKIGMQHFTTLLPASTAHLPTDQPTMAEMMKSQGYVTHMLGKWHLGASSWNHTPTGRGFDSFFGYLQGQNDYLVGTANATRNTDPTNPTDPKDGFDRWHNRTAAWETYNVWAPPLYRTEVDRILDRAVVSGERFFLYWAVQEAHIPLYEVPAPYMELCSGLQEEGPYPAQDCGTLENDVCCPPNRQLLCAMVSVLDEQVGHLVKGLRSRGLYENTLIWFSTDNGGMTAYQYQFPGSASSNWPLRAGKTTLFEGGVRGIGFVSGGFLPEQARGTQFFGLSHVIDVFPTLAGLVGYNNVSSVVDGTNVWPAMTGAKGTAQRDELCINIDTSFVLPGLGALIKGDMKLVLGVDNLPSGTGLLPFGAGAYDGWWHSEPAYWHEKANKSQRAGRLHLFNLTADPVERENLAEIPRYFVLLESMRASLLSYAEPRNGYIKPQPNAMCNAGDACYPENHNGTMAPWL